MELHGQPVDAHSDVLHRPATGPEAEIVTQQGTLQLRLKVYTFATATADDSLQ
jgi:hypothetical protein